ncbi:MAG: hypothetical protein K2Y07_05415 [Nitrosomonas sp.]|nr:hypothetical protein [Nitrosomonas sp.]OQW84407.1 MAG: hypothetical protein BVN30_03240 [Proteobacteria bacterium ST_bin16]
MRFLLKNPVVLLIIFLMLTACVIPPTRNELLSQKVIFSRNSGKNYLEIAECLKSDDGFPLPKQQRHTWRDINTYFIYHESVQVDGYPQLHDEVAKIYYITEIHDPKYSGSSNQPITHGNGNWIMTIKNTGNEQKNQSEIEIHSNQNLLSDYPPVSYTPDSNASLSQRLYKVEKIDHCF